jgi:hypothetical protein
MDDSYYNPQLTPRYPQGEAPSLPVEDLDIPRSPIDQTGWYIPRSQPGMPQSSTLQPKNPVSSFDRDDDPCNKETGGSETGQYQLSSVGATARRGRVVSRLPRPDDLVSSSLPCRPAPAKLREYADPIEPPQTMGEPIGKAPEIPRRTNTTSTDNPPYQTRQSVTPSPDSNWSVKSQKGSDSFVQCPSDVPDSDLLTLELAHRNPLRSDVAEIKSLAHRESA